VRTVVTKVKLMPNTKAAIAYLSKTPTTEGGREVGQALAELKEFGHITESECGRSTGYANPRRTSASFPSACAVSISPWRVRKH
jgi:hypothetical protein